MSDLVSTIVRSVSEQKSQQNQRKSTVVRTCGEEHWARSNGALESGNGGDVATIYFATDPEMAYLAQWRFKLIIGNPSAPVPSASGGVVGYNIEEVGDLLSTTHTPFTSVREFYRVTNGNGVNMDSSYGLQCWDLADYFWANNAHETLYTGTQYDPEQTGCFSGVYYSWANISARTHNLAGGQFELITDPNNILPGDWLILDLGTKNSCGNKIGHIVMSLQSSNSDNFITNSSLWCLAQNGIGGVPHPAGGAYANTNNIKITSSNFVGAFRWKDPDFDRTPPTGF